VPNPNQRAGRAWEEDAARFLREHGHPAADTLRVRHPDVGDIGGVEDWTLECKAPGPGSSGRLYLPKWMDQLGKARASAGTPYGAVVFRRSRATADRAFMIVEFGMGAAIMRRLAEEGGA
jgi:hypothetical protein